MALRVTFGREKHLLTYGGICHKFGQETAWLSQGNLARMNNVPPLISSVLCHGMTFITCPFFFMCEVGKWLLSVSVRVGTEGLAYRQACGMVLSQAPGFI